MDPKQTYGVLSSRSVDRKSTKGGIQLIPATGARGAGFLRIEIKRFRRVKLYNAASADLGRITR